jgi:hypothetical protein
MELDYKASNRMSNKLRSILRDTATAVAVESGLRWDSSTVDLWTDAMMRSAVSVSPPQQGEPPPMWFIVMGAPGNPVEPTSRRLGNVRFNIGKLCKGVITLTLSIPAMANVPWLAVLVFSRGVIDLAEAMEVKLSEREAMVVWTMWTIATDDNVVPSGRLLDQVNGRLTEYGRSTITQQQLDEALTKLKKVRFVETSKTDPSAWWLRDWVQVRYT